MKAQHCIYSLAVALLLQLTAAASGTAAEWHKAAVTLSDGRTLRGKVCIIRNRVQIYDLSSQEKRLVSVKNIKRIQSRVQEEFMARQWFFKESGSDEKVYTGKKSPIRRFRTLITFHDGSTIRGNIMARTMYVETDEGRKRFQLLRKQEGEVGQKLSDLVHVKSVTFTGDGKGVTGNITALVRTGSGERIRKAVALNTDQIFIRQARRGGRKLRFPRCTTGTYDLLFVTDRAIYVAFSAASDADRLNSRQVADIQNWIDNLRDYYTTQRVLYGVGTPKKAFVLVFRERSGNTHGSTALTRRYDVWVMHRSTNQWRIKKRIGIFRMTSKKKDVPRRKLVVQPALGGHKIGPKHPQQKLQVTLKNSGREPIPRVAKDGPVWPASASDNGRKSNEQSGR